MFNNVIVGIDDQSDSSDAIDLAKRLRTEDGELTLAHGHHSENDARARLQSGGTVTATSSPTLSSSAPAGASVP